MNIADMELKIIYPDDIESFFPFAEKHKEIGTKKCQASSKNLRMVPGTFFVIRSRVLIE
jgi:hypothetical protein